MLYKIDVILGSYILEARVCASQVFSSLHDPYLESSSATADKMSTVFGPPLSD